MDLQDRKILNLLQKDGRCSYAEIGKQVGLSITAIKDRIDKLQGKGILRNFSVDVAELKAGYSVLAFVFIGIDKTEDCKNFEETMLNLPQIQECHHVSGAFTYLLKVVAEDMQTLEFLLKERIKLPGVVSRTETTIVFSSSKNSAFVDCLGTVVAEN